MSTVEYDFEMNGMSVSRRGTPSRSTPVRPQARIPQQAAPVPRAPVVTKPQGLHRVSEVRQQQGVSLRSVARKMDLPIQEVRDQEEPNSDLRVSELLKWQEVLEVPLTDLLVDTQGPLSEPVSKRASMLRVMKTAKAILESSKSKSIHRMADMLIDQLVQIMPELADVSAWHTVGQRRTQDEVGRIVERPIPDSFFGDGSH